jgi:hypothetical protein
MRHSCYFAWCCLLLRGSQRDWETCYLLLPMKGSERDCSREIGKRLVLLVFSRQCVQWGCCMLITEKYKEGDGSLSDTERDGDIEQCDITPVCSQW